jgi:hypothetical protein
MFDLHGGHTQSLRVSEEGFHVLGALHGMGCSIDHQPRSGHPHAFGGDRENESTLEWTTHPNPRSEEGEKCDLGLIWDDLA